MTFDGLDMTFGGLDMTFDGQGKHESKYMMQLWEIRNCKNY
jgi:hypothetical protein